MMAAAWRRCTVFGTSCCYGFSIDCVVFEQQPATLLHAKHCQCACDAGNTPAFVLSASQVACYLTIIQPGLFTH